jgi:NAD(P)-dependent dehydrogenase (short-subunit alcohol dehydrogenase family)
MRPLTEQVILITGATDGLGKAVAIQLAHAGATLLLHGRGEARGQHTLEEIRARTGNTHLQWYRADFAALAQVRTLAERLAREQERASRAGQQCRHWDHPAGRRHPPGERGTASHGGG